jgi:tRNA 2-thiouridine synthesizing protein A
MAVLDHVDQTLDCQGMLCPIPVVKTNKKIKEMAVGQTLLMLATDPGSMPDMTAWAKQTGQELIGSEQQGKLFKFYIRKAK